MGPADHQVFDCEKMRLINAQKWLQLKWDNLKSKWVVMDRDKYGLCKFQFTLTTIFCQVV